MRAIATLRQLTRQVLRRAPASPEPEPGQPRGWPADPSTDPAPLWVPMGLGLLIAIGVSMVACGYGLGREGRALATPLVWSGQVVAFGAALYSGARSKLGIHQRRLLVMTYVLGQVCMTIAYSPVIFRFPDELQHLRTVNDILATHHLFTPNPTLPVSPGFPGLEVVTTFVHGLIGLPVVPAGRLVVGTAHLLLGGVVFILMRSLQLSERVAAIGVVLFVTSPSNVMFNQLYIYGALAIPFVWVTGVAAARPSRSGVVLPSILGIGATVICTVTHPASAMLALAGLWVLLAGGLMLRQPVIVRRLALTAGVSTLFAVVWILLRAPEVVAYMSQPFHTVARSLTGGPETSDQPATHVVPRPAWQLPIMSASVLIQAGATFLGIALAWRQRAPQRAMLFISVSSLFFVVVALRFVPGDGSELSTRLWAYVSAFSAGTIGAVIVAFSSRRIFVPITAACAAVMVLGNVAIGWPGPWEQTPGKGQIGAFEAGISGPTISLGDWAAAHLRLGDRVACDLMACAVVASYSPATPTLQVSAIYYATSFDDPAVATELKSSAYGYVIIDRRMTTDDAVLGSYFPLPQDSPLDTGKPLTGVEIAKFASDPRVTKVFDDGFYTVYDVSRVPR